MGEARSLVAALAALAAAGAACSLAVDLSDLGGGAAPGDVVGPDGGGSAAAEGGASAWPDGGGLPADGPSAAPTDGPRPCRENPIDLMAPTGMILGGAAAYREGVLELTRGDAPSGTAGAGFGRTATELSAELEYDAPLAAGGSFELALFWTDRPFDPARPPPAGRPPGCGQAGVGVLFRRSASASTVELVDLADCARPVRTLDFADLELGGRHRVRVTLGPFFGVEATVVYLDGNGKGGNGPTKRITPVHFGVSAAAVGTRVVVSGAKVTLPLEPPCPGGTR